MQQRQRQRRDAERNEIIIATNAVRLSQRERDLRRAQQILDAIPYTDHNHHIHPIIANGFGNLAMRHRTMPEFRRVIQKIHLDDRDRILAAIADRCPELRNAQQIIGMIQDDGERARQFRDLAIRFRRFGDRENALRIIQTRIPNHFGYYDAALQDLADTAPTFEEAKNMICKMTYKHNKYIALLGLATAKHRNLKQIQQVLGLIKDQDALDQTLLQLVRTNADGQQFVHRIKNPHILQSAKRHLQTRRRQSAKDSTQMQGGGAGTNHNSR